MSYVLSNIYRSSGDNKRFARKPQVINCNECVKSNVWGQTMIIPFLLNQGFVDLNHMFVWI